MSSVVIAAALAMSESVSLAEHRGEFWTERYTNHEGPGMPGHGRPSVTRKKKAKTHGKNKRKRK
ncbi:hypothetical protein [Enterobacter phage EspM4VN]|uniref:Uncharacterized protein n=1 Tax=Enterobacter phage EspM4VN TaxID=2137745 RepID=A0A4P2WV48_9CAUD|nr:hypothetical protein HYP11_gp064 [Enterobacter phage EspM4VN]BBK03742.1 hypothetical protein [Enterobacter phage EspM4VN]